MKFSVFSDIHHYPGVFKSNTPGGLLEIQKRALDENVDFIIQCGDFTHNPEKFRDFVDLYNNFSIPSYHCLGNHDTDSVPLDRVLELYRMPGPYYSFDINGFRMIVMCADYYYLNGEYVPYNLGNYYKFPKLRDYVPPEELEWLKETINCASGPCLIFSHESFDRDGAAVKNRQLVRNIISAANAKRKGSVLMCLNGHYHRNHLSIRDQVAYFDVNSASYDWTDIEHSCYPEEECRKYSLLNHTVCWNDPIHAIVEITEDGEIHIKGMQSEMYLGIERVDTGNAFADPDGRPAEPKVLSANFKLMI